MIPRLDFVPKLCLVVLLIIIIKPIHCEENASNEPDTRVEPDYGSPYFGFYKYYLNLSPNEINGPVKLSIYSPKSLPWSNKPIYEKSFKPDMGKSQIECQLDENDYIEIKTKIVNLIDAPGNKYQKENPEKAVLGQWRYQFFINNIACFKNLKDGPDIVLCWGLDPMYNFKNKSYSYPIYAREDDLEITLSLKYERDDRFSDFADIGVTTTDYKENEWNTIYFDPTDLPNDALESSGLSQEKRKKILAHTVLKAVRKGNRHS